MIYGHPAANHVLFALRYCIRQPGKVFPFVNVALLSVGKAVIYTLMRDGNNFVVNDNKTVSK